MRTVGRRALSDLADGVVISMVVGAEHELRVRVVVADHRTPAGTAFTKEFTGGDEPPSELLRHLIEAREAVHLERPDCDWSGEALSPAAGEFFARRSATAMLIAPVVFDDEVVGTLGCWREHPAAGFGDDDRLTLEHIARVIGPILRELHPGRSEHPGVVVPNEPPSLRRLFDVSNALLFASADGHFTLLNPAWERALGWPLEVLKERPLIEFVHPDDREATLEAAAKVGMPGYEILDFENRYRRHDGAYRWLRWYAVADGAQWYGAARDVTAERETENALERSLRDHQAVVDAALDCIVTMDPAGRVLDFNPAAEEVFGYPREAVVGRELAELIIPERLRERHRAALARLAEGGAGNLIGRRAEFDATRRDGSELPVELTITVTEDEPRRYIGFMRDLSNERAAVRVAQTSEERYRQIVETTAEGVWTLDLEHRTTFVNPAMAEMLGYSPEEMVGRPPSAFMDAADARAAMAHLARSAGLSERSVEARLKHRDGSHVWTEQRVRDLRDAWGGVVGRLKLVADVTARRAAAHQQQLLAAIVESSDDAILAKTLEGTITAWNRGAERLYGYTAEEAIGSRITDLIIPLELHADHDRIVRQVGRGARIDHFETERRRKDGYRIHVSISASPLRDHDGGISGVAVIARDITARKAHEDEMHRQLEAASWVTRIREAIDEDRLVVWSQPIIRLVSGEATQEELLVRMIDRDGTVIPPGAFLPAAEEFGLVRDIDAWVVREAARLAARGRCVEVNLSAQSVGRREVLDEIELALRESGADPRNITFEITETALMQDMEAGAKFANRLAELGCRFALDDFGTGFGSFTYLKQLPVNSLKIDIEFVRELRTDPANEHVVRAVVNLARGFELETVAEGVEDEETLQLLRTLGVDYAQGYHIGRPAPLVTAETAERSVEDGERREQQT